MKRIVNVNCTELMNIFLVVMLHKELITVFTTEPTEFCQGVFSPNSPTCHGVSHYVAVDGLTRSSPPCHRNGFSLQFANKFGSADIDAIG